MVFSKKLSHITKEKLIELYKDDEGKSKFYYPDFYIPKYNIYLEVKGFFDDKMKEKLKMVSKSYNVNIEVWFRSDLEELNVFKYNKLEKDIKNGHYRKYEV
jgi:hypothetical protein